MKKAIAIAKFVGYTATCGIVGAFMGEGCKSMLNSDRSAVSKLLGFGGWAVATVITAYAVSNNPIAENISNDIVDAFFEIPEPEDVTLEETVGA